MYKRKYIFSRNVFRAERRAWALGHYLVYHFPLTRHQVAYDSSRALVYPLIANTLSFIGADDDGLYYALDGVGGGITRGRVLSLSNAGGAEPHLNFTTNSHSVSAWVRYGSSFGTNYPGIVGKCKAASSFQGYLLYVWMDTPGVPIYQIGDSVSVASVIWGSVLTDDEHFVVGVCDRAANLLKISVDGEAFVSVDCSSVGSVANDGFFNIGSRPDAGGAFANKFIGRVRDVRVWPTHALTQSEVQALYTEREPQQFRRVWQAAPALPAATLPKLGPGLPGAAEFSLPGALGAALGARVAHGLRVNPRLNRRALINPFDWPDE